MDGLKQSAGKLAQRTGLSGKLPVNKSDAIASITTGIANVPDGMASGVLAGVNPIFGVYTLIIGTPVAALTASTQLMMFNTTSAMTLVATDGLGSRTGDDRVQAIVAIALVAGVFQLALGLLGLGIIIKFVSNAVMTGFLTGIATLIIMGQLWDLTGFEGEGGSKLEQTAQLMANLRDIDLATTFLGVGSIVVMVLLGRTKFATFNLLIALGIAAAVQYIFDFSSVSLVQDIPSGLPSIEIPKLSLVPAMLLAGVATGAVGLLQAAGVAQAYPNPDGSDSSNSRDFLGQGLANIASSFFRGMAGGGSLSGTALNVSAGARTRYAAVMQAVIVVLVLLFFTGLLSKIPNAALAALLIYAAALSFNLAAIGAVRRTSRLSLVAMVATFLATLVVPLQQAVVLGVVLASILFIYRASVDVRVAEIRISGTQLTMTDPPAVLPDNAVTVIDVDGNLFYAGARTLSERLPDAKESVRPTVVLRLRGQSEVGSTFFKVIGKYAEQIRENGGRLILTGVDPRANARMDRAGLIDQIGQENVILAESTLGASTITGYQLGQNWLAGLPEIAIPTAEPTEAPAPVQIEKPVVSPDVEAERLPDVDRASVLRRLSQFSDQNIPWRSNAVWQSSFAVGALLLVTGVAGVLFPSTLSGIFRGLMGGILVLIACFWVYQTLSERGRERRIAAELRMFSAGVALMAGSAMILAEFVDLMSEDAARLIFGYGIVFIGLSGLAVAWFLGEGTTDRMAAVAVNAVVIGLGAVGLYQLYRGETLFKPLMWLAAAAGTALIAYSIFIFRRQRHRQDAAEVLRE